MSNYTCLAVILIDFVLKKDENYYLQVFLKECKYIEREKKIIRYIIDDLEISSDYSEKKNSDKEDQKRIILMMIFFLSII